MFDSTNRTQNAPRTSQPPSAVTSPQIQREQQPSTSKEPSPSTNGTSSASTSKQPGDGDDKRVPSPAPTPSFGSYMGQEIPQVTIQDTQRLASDLSPVTEEPGSSTDLVCSRQCLTAGYRILSIVEIPIRDSREWTIEHPRGRV